ncbi:DUF6283 family protein [Actinophytocola glycyrrhizae]|uniref:DUF6283 family protein n=1 Tax=Actinophytocola glycyrrhizae TaxID=2044873 RepID=A0ABV9SCW0_9PSEU
MPAGAASHGRVRGFLLRGAAHNLSVRLHEPGGEDVSSDRPRYDSYRDMAIANGVTPNAPALQRCRHSGIGATAKRVGDLGRRTRRA